LTVQGEKGYAMVRGTHCVRADYWADRSWYYEVELLSLPAVNDAAVRVGFAQAQADGQCPVGYDGFGYAIRSRKGTVFHQAKGKSYTAKKEGFEEGDVIGCEIFIPKEKEVTKTLPDTLKEATLVKFKSFYYFESRTNKKANKDSLTPRPGSWIQFYRNGSPLGKAFENIKEGVYYPALSLFKTAKVKVNFGPEWKNPPKKSEMKLNSFHEMGFRGEIQQSVSDLLFAVDLKINGII